MKKFRFILALVLVLTMVLSTPLMALAKSWDVTDSAGVENAFATDTDDEVIINMQNDIVMENSVVANEGQNYTINGNGNTISDVNIGGAGSVEIEADVAVENSYYDAIQDMYYDAGLIVGEKASVTVNGDVEGVVAKDNAEVTVNGDVTGASGNPDYVDYSDPLSCSDAGDAVDASGEAEVTVNGNVTGGDAYGTYGYAGEGVDAEDQAKVTVNGNVTGGSVTADPEVEANSYVSEYDGETYYNVSSAGYGVAADGEATVIVTGDVTGGSTNGDMGNGGYGVYAENTATVEVGGNVTGGDTTNGTAGAGIYTENATQITVGGDVTGGAATDGGESAPGIVAESYGDYREDNEEGVEQGTVTVEGTVSGGDGAASIYFNAPEELGEILEQLPDAEELTEKDPAEFADIDYFALEGTLMAMMENGDLTEEELEKYQEEFENINSQEEYIAFIQQIIKDEMVQTVNLKELLVENMDYSLITVGSVSEKNGPAYGSPAGEEFAKLMAEKHVTETAVTPNTGDGFNPMLVLAVALVSLMGTAALVFKKKAA